MDDYRVIARDSDVVQEDRAVRPAADRHALVLEREALALAPAAGPYDQRCALRLDELLQLDRHQIAGRLVDSVRRRRRLGLRVLQVTEVGTALLAVVGAVGVEKPALRAVQSHGRSGS